MKTIPALKSPEPVDAEISALVKRLNSRKPGVVRAAVAQLIERGDDGFEALLTALTRQAKRRKVVRHSYGVFFIGTLCISALLSISEPKLALIGLAIAFFTTPLIVAFSVLYAVQSGLVVTELDDVRVVGVLTEALYWGDAEVVLLARDTLTRVLPRLNESHAKYLSSLRRTRLLDQFDDWQSSKELLFAILKAMEQVGGAEALPMVSLVAAGKSPSNQYVGMADAAQACLLFLQVRAEGRELRDTLLRSSSAAEVAPDTLLRPAPMTSEEPAHELLRPRE